MALGPLIKSAIQGIAPPTEPDQSFGQALVANFEQNPGPPEITGTFIGDAFSLTVLGLAHPENDLLG
jgi:hypothetical protein